MLTELLLFVPLAILTNTIFPFPFDYVLIYFAENHAVKDVWIFAGLGSICAGVGGFADVRLLGALGRYAGRGTRWTAWDLHKYWFYAVVFFIAILPIPYLTVRMVLLRGAPRLLPYVITLAAGRLPRYLLILYAWEQLSLPSWASTALLVSAIPFTLWQVRRWQNRQSNPAEQSSSNTADGLLHP